MLLCLPMQQEDAVAWVKLGVQSSAAAQSCSAGSAVQVFVFSRIKLFP